MCLVGWVAQAPGVDAEAGRLVVATRDAEDHVERHVVLAGPRLRADLDGVHTADLVCVEGRLERDHVAARSLWVVTEGPRGHPAAASAVGTHASPRPHDRRGHWRRVALGTVAERLVWVRATRVAARAECDCAAAWAPGVGAAAGGECRPPPTAGPTLGVAWAPAPPRINGMTLTEPDDQSDAGPLGGPAAPWSMGPVAGRARVT